MLDPPQIDSEQALDEEGAGVHIAAEQRDEVVEAVQMLSKCVLTKSQLRMWGFPAENSVPERQIVCKRTSTRSVSSVATFPRNFAPTTPFSLSEDTARQILRCAHSFQRGLQAASVASDAIGSETDEVIDGTFLATLPRTVLQTLVSSLQLPLTCEDMVALDCEMLETAEEGAEVVRCSLISLRNRIDNPVSSSPEHLLLDSITLPLCTPLPLVQDYKTAFTGLNEQLLNALVAAKHTLSQQQLRATLLLLISAETTLVGHSLESDLKALRICHSKVVDTTVLYPHPRGFPLRLSLRHLVHLHRSLLETLPVPSSSSASSADLSCVEDPSEHHSSVWDATMALRVALHVARQRHSGILSASLSVQQLCGGGGAVDEERVSLLHRLSCHARSSSDGHVSNGAGEDKRQKETAHGDDQQAPKRMKGDAAGDIKQLSTVEEDVLVRGVRSLLVQVTLSAEADDASAANVNVDDAEVEEEVEGIAAQHNLFHALMHTAEAEAERISSCVSGSPNRNANDSSGRAAEGVSTQAVRCQSAEDAVSAVGRFLSSSSPRNTAKHASSELAGEVAEQVHGNQNKKRPRDELEHNAAADPESRSDEGPMRFVCVHVTGSRTPSLPEIVQQLASSFSSSRSASSDNAPKDAGSCSSTLIVALQQVDTSTVLQSMARRRRLLYGQGRDAEDVWDSGQEQDLQRALERAHLAQCLLRVVPM